MSALSHEQFLTPQALAWRRFWTILVQIVLPAAVCVLAVVLIRHQFHDLSWEGLKKSIRSIPRSRIMISLGLSLLNYVVLIGYDRVSLRAIGKQFSWAQTAFASFTGFAVSYNFGTLLGGTAVRSRLYATWGLSASEIVRLVILLGTTFWIGVFALAGVMFLIAPFPIPPALQEKLPVSSLAVLGVILLVIASLWFCLPLFRKEPIRLGRFELTIPPLKILWQQLAVSVADFVIAGGCLYVLLPDSVTIGFWPFISIFLLANVSVVLTHAPGGAGIFEVVILNCMPPEIKTEVLASLLVFRVIYQLLPLSVALTMLAGHEYYLRRSDFAVIHRTVGRALGSVTPNLIAYGTMFIGAVLLFSGARPSAPWRRGVLEEWLPLEAVEASHFLASLAGAGLLILGRGLQRRFDSAWAGAFVLVIAGSIFTFIKGLDYEEAIGAAGLILVLWFSRKSFYRHGSIFRPTWSVGWIAAVGIIVSASIWLVIFTHEHGGEFSNDMFWQFTFDGGAPRALRAELGVVVTLLAFAGAKMISGGHSQQGPLPTLQDLDEARRIIATGGRTSANLALLGDKSLLFNQARTAFLMYRVQGRSWVVLGDPVGPREEWSQLVWHFREIVDRADGWTVFYQICSENLTLYLDQGMALFKLGEEARVEAATFQMTGKSRQAFRTTKNKLQKLGYVLKVLQPVEVEHALPQLREISDAWLLHKGRPEKGFSLGYFDERYLEQFPCATIEQDGKVIAFANLWTSPDKDEFSIDLMRYAPDSPPGLMDFLFCELLSWGQEQGFKWFNLGMAPLSGIETHRLSPMWNKVAAMIFRHGDHFYQFEGLREYKDKFDPVWTPKYLASPGGLALPNVLRDVTRLIGSQRLTVADE